MCACVCVCECVCKTASACVWVCVPCECGCVRRVHAFWYACVCARARALGDESTGEYKWHLPWTSKFWFLHPPSQTHSSYQRVRVSSMALVRAWPRWREPVTLGGGIAIMKTPLGCSGRRSDCRGKHSPFVCLCVYVRKCVLARVQGVASVQFSTYGIHAGTCACVAY